MPQFVANCRGYKMYDKVVDDSMANAEMNRRNQQEFLYLECIFATNFTKHQMHFTKIIEKQKYKTWTI